MDLMRWIAVVLVAVGTIPALAAQTVTEIITLQHRTVEEVIPVVQPLLPREGRVTGLRGQLVVRTTPANLAELRQVLAALDTPLKQLQITVAQGSRAEAARGGSGLSGQMGAGDPRVQVRIYDTRSLDDVRVLQTLQVTEGRSAFILVGESRPVRDRAVARTIVGGRVVEHVVDGVDYRDANTGFYVRPRVMGERVTLDIAPQREAFVPGRPGAVDVQRVSTTLSGALGEWIEVGGSVEERGSDREVLLGRAGARGTEHRSIYLKVEAVR